MKRGRECRHYLLLTKYVVDMISQSRQRGYYEVLDESLTSPMPFLTVWSYLTMTKDTMNLKPDRNLVLDWLGTSDFDHKYQLLS